MAACGSIQHLFNQRLPENPTLLDTLAPWNHIKPKQSIELSSCTEIFGELHFEAKPESPESPLPMPLDQDQPQKFDKSDSDGKNPSLDSSLGTSKSHNMGSSFASSNSESLQLCTEGLGSESSDEVEISKNERGQEWRIHENVDRNLKNYTGGTGGSISPKRSMSAGSFPPPISCLGGRGKPCFGFRSYRHDGRFVLTEIKIPNHDILHASREDGRLKLHLLPSEKITDEEKDDDEEKEKEAAAVSEICQG